MSSPILKYIISSWIFTSIFLIPQFVGAQGKDSLLKKFTSYRKNAYQEKLYAHIDRAHYLTGETLWFKIYCVDGSFHRPSDLSKVVYVEIIDKMNRPLLQTKISISRGAGDGSILIPASLTSGNYRFRAYTQWMKNFSADFHFEKMLTIINPFIKLETVPLPRSTGWNVQFFPEGGNLVAGLESKVAFKAYNASGAGIDCRGALLDEANDTLLIFRSLKFGIGNFVFTPLPNKQYRVLLETGEDHYKSSSLPIINAKGFVMRIHDEGQLLRVDVSGRNDNQAITSPVYLFAHTRQIICHAEMRLLRDGTTTFLLDKKDLKEGISHLTIFDAGLKPVCERLFFKQPKNMLPVNVTSAPLVGTRRKVVLEIQTPSSCNLSVAVYKTDSLHLPGRDHIFDHFWLGSDLRGLIESPTYYFSQDRDVTEAADNLMLTHGWRRFSWSAILANEPQPLNNFPEYRGPVIQGQVTRQGGLPASGVQTYLSSTGRGIRLYESKSNPTGEVFYEMKHFYGHHNILAQADTRKDSLYQIKIQSPFSSQFASDSLPELHLSPSLKKQILARSISVQVQDVYNRSLDDGFRKIQVDSLPFYGNPDETYNLDDYTRFPVMEEVMREYVPGVFVRKRKDGFHFFVLDHVKKNMFKDDPLVLLDGLPIFDVDTIMAFDPLKVKKLEVVTRQYYLGRLTFSGIVSYTTYGGDLGGFQIDPKSATIDYQGLQLQREFRSPIYESSQPLENRLPDQRNLLYWNPSVVVDAKGTYQIEFYSSDLTGNFQVVMEGLSSDGRAGGSVCTFSVKDAEK